MNAAKVKVKEVWIRRAEGLPEECVALTLQSIAEADAVLRRWALTAPADGCYDKCDFTIAFEDGDTYSGRYDLKRHDAGHADLIGRHVRQFVEFYAGLWKPPHWSEEDYEREIRRDVERCLKYKEFLDKYEIG